MMTNVVIQRFLIEVACVDLHSEIPSLKVDIRCGSGSEKQNYVVFQKRWFSVHKCAVVVVLLFPS